jgi:hypothetical protein
MNHQINPQMHHVNIKSVTEKKKDRLPAPRRFDKATAVALSKSGLSGRNAK